jgi:hypothetical protein
MTSCWRTSRCSIASSRITWAPAWPSSRTSIGSGQRDLGAPELIAPELIHRLAYFSGGRARDFTKLVRELAERGLAEELPHATAAAVEDVISEAQKACERGLHAGHARVLRQAMADPYRLPEDPLAQRLIEWARLLPFDNERPWFHPHPLLRKRFLSQAGSPG